MLAPQLPDRPPLSTKHSKGYIAPREAQTRRAHRERLVDSPWIQALAGSTLGEVEASGPTRAVFDTDCGHGRVGL